MSKDRVIISVPVAVMPSFTDKGKKYALTMHGYVTCSCMSANNPLPGQRYGECKHTEKFTEQSKLRTDERQQLVEAINDAKARLRAFDGGDVGQPLSIPVGWRLPEQGETL